MVIPSPKDPITFVFIIFILGAFSWPLIYMRRKIKGQASAELAKALEILKPYNRETIYDAYDSVKEELLKLPTLGMYWREFNESLFPDQADHLIHNSKNPRDFFTENHLIHKLCEQSLTALH